MRRVIINSIILLLSTAALLIAAFIGNAYLLAPGHLFVPLPLPASVVVRLLALCVLPALLIAASYGAASKLLAGKKYLTAVLNIIPYAMLIAVIYTTAGTMSLAERDYSMAEHLSFINPEGIAFAFVNTNIVWLVVLLSSAGAAALWRAAHPILEGRKRLAVAVCMLAVLVGSSLLLNANPISIAFPSPDENGEGITVANINNNHGNLTLRFSEADHFHADGIVVEITASEPNAGIFYTTDGSAPTAYSEQYTEPIYFGMQSEIYAVVLRAIAVYEDFATEPLTHTYFIGEEIHERFGEDILVFSLSTNPDYLFDHDIGILVEGRLREAWDRDFPGMGTWERPANFNLRGRETERPVHVETLTHYGERVLTQAAGVRVAGNFSRSLPQKSLRLIARREYSPEAGRFNVDFFPNVVVSDGSPLTRNDSLNLRNGGNTWLHCMSRNELGIALAIEAGLLAVPFRAAAVFLNGEYYGFAWLQVHTNEQYLEDLFNAPTREFDIVRGGERWFRVEHRNIDERAIADLEFKNSFAYKDLLDDVIFAELETIVDIDNLLLYFAFQILVGNRDWPNNNLRRWRYTGEQIEGLATELDGRWRYAIFDLDASLGYTDGRTFHRVLVGDNRESPLLANILIRPDMVDRFAMIMCDLAANIINSQNVSGIIDITFNEGVWDEIGHWAVRWDRDLDLIANEHKVIIDFASYHHEYIFGSLSQHFGFSLDMFDVNVLGGEAIIGTQSGTSSRYFNHLVVPVSPVLPEFHKFDHWVLNGERIYDADIIVSLDDAVADADGNYAVELELVTHFAIPPLVISELYEIGVGNGMVLVNLTDEEVHTSGLFLSNESGNLQRWALPAMTVAPGESLRLAGRGSRTPEHLYWIQMDFNVREGRKFWLSDIDGNIIDSFSLRGADRAVRDLAAIG